MSFTLGNCATGTGQFNIPTDVPQVVEDPYQQYLGVSEYISKLSVQAARGLWSIRFRVEHLPWDGTPHAQPISQLTFKCGLTDGSSLTHAGFVIAGWPCSVVSPTSFADYSDWFNEIGIGAVPNNGSVCYSSMLMDLGCPNCGAQYLELHVLAASHLAFGNAYGFRVWCRGTRIG